MRIHETAARAEEDLKTHGKLQPQSLAAAGAVRDLTGRTADDHPRNTATPLPPRARHAAASSTIPKAAATFARAAGGR